MKTNRKRSTTCIALVKNKQGKLMMAGDRRASWGFHLAESMEVPKVNKKDGFLVGATGDCALCSLFVNDGGFQFPEKKVKSINTYMFNILKPAVFDYLIYQKFGTEEGKHSKLTLSPDTLVEIVIGIDGEAWSLTICNPLSEDSDTFAGELELVPVSVPYATGCGGMPAIGMIKYELKKTGYVSKANLKMMLETVADISPGCDDKVDIIVED